MKLPQTAAHHLPKPDWLKTRISSLGKYAGTSATINKGALHTICSSGRCPNMAECWSRGTATLMIGGNECTRACRFCATDSSKCPAPLDPLEPQRIATAISQMKIRYAVITSVDRDDLPDGGAAHWASCIREVRRVCPKTKIEVLIPDFGGDLSAIDHVLDTQPDVVGHNLETVRRLTPSVRHIATYDGSINVLKHISNRGFPTKTGLMVGLGETPEEVQELMQDSFAAGVSILTIGQYLRPSTKQIPVVEYIHPNQFKEYKRIGEKIGIKHVESGALVRSSYRADHQFDQAQANQTSNPSLINSPL